MYVISLLTINEKFSMNEFILTHRDLVLSSLCTLNMKHLLTLEYK